MTYSEIIRSVEAFAEKHCRRCPYDPTLWENHTQLVREFALQLAQIEGADKQVVEIAALLHDAGKYKGRIDHHLTGYKLARDFLETVDLPDDKKALILKCILKHRTRFAVEDNEIEVKVVQSADVLGTLFDETWQTHSQNRMSREALGRLYDKAMGKINLESARRLAAPQLEKLRTLLEDYQS